MRSAIALKKLFSQGYRNAVHSNTCAIRRRRRGEPVGDRANVCGSTGGSERKRTSCVARHRPGARSTRASPLT